MAFVYTVKDTDTAGLNSIVSRFGYSNYKDAGITAVPSGNFDVIRAGDQITLPNYDPNNVQTIGSTPPVVSSKDNAQQYRDDSNKLDGITSAFEQGQKDTTKDSTAGKTTETYTPFATGAEKTVDGKTVVETTGDPILDKLNKWETEQDARFQQTAAANKANYESLYQTSLAAVDATAQATINNINSTYDKRIAEQNRINKLNIDRVKAYGLSSGGQYTPISFGDAISNREQEAADKISELDSQRNSLIAQAKAARDAGASQLLRDKLEDLDKIDEQLRKNLSNVEAEADKQYKLLRDLRQEEEKKHTAALDKMRTNLAAIAPQYADEYGSLSDEEKDKFIEKVSKQTGLDYATIYGVLESSVADKEKAALEKKKTEADIEATKALTTQRNASAADSFASAATKNQDRKDKQSMNADLPDTFTSDDDFNAKRQAYVKKYGTNGAKLWDETYNKDDVGDYTYTIDAGGGADRVTVIAPDGTEGTIPKAQLAEALKEGYKQK